MSNYELLRLAAKARGLQDIKYLVWQPDKNLYDSVELAAALKLNIVWTDSRVYAVPASDPNNKSVWTEYSDNCSRMDAMMLSIAKAAAEIGARMP